jgi:hypothetical protein
VDVGKLPNHVNLVFLLSICLFFIKHYITFVPLVLSVREIHDLLHNNNDFNSSQIPTGFKQLPRLTNLNLSYYVFSSQITSEILELSNLISLDLSRNSLKLQKPGLRSIAHKLTNMKELHLNEVDISSTVPNVLANLSSLTSLILVDCGLHGEFLM